MKSLIVSAVIGLSAMPLYAAQYKCTLSNGQANDATAVVFEFDTATQDNKFVDLGQGTEVGCVVLRSKPQLVTCGIGNAKAFSIFATAEDGTSVFGFSANSNGKKATLTCVKQL